MIKFFCPNCNKKLGVQDDYGGKTVWCPACTNKTAVPVLQADNQKFDMTNANENTQYSVSICNAKSDGDQGLMRTIIKKAPEEERITTAIEEADPGPHGDAR